VEVERLPKPTREEAEYRQDKAFRYVTYTDEEYIARQANEGYVVDTFLLTIVDNVVVGGDETRIYRDTYPNRNEVIYVGVTQRWEP